MPTQNSSSQITISGVDTPNGEINTQTGIGNPTEIANIQIGFYWYGNAMSLSRFEIYNHSDHSSHMTYNCPASMQTLPNYTSGIPTPITFTIQCDDFASWSSADVYTYVTTSPGTTKSSGITVSSFSSSYVYNSTAPSDHNPVPVIIEEDEKEPQEGQEGNNDE